jgi:YihY family inner membrane protein
MDPKAILSRVLDQPRVALVMAVLDTYGRAAGGLLANGLAFSSLFAAIPTTLLVLGLAGWIAGNTAVRDSISAALINAFPPLEDLIEASLDAITQGAAAASILGVIGLVWTVSQLYGALDVAFARIFADVPERDIVSRTARGFLVVGILAIAILVFVVAATLSSAIDTQTDLDMPVVSALAGLIGSTPFLVIVAIVAVLIVYRWLPPRAPSWRAAWPPAVVVGIAIVVLTQVFTFLVPRLVGVAALAGSLASAFIALAWLSFGFQALLYGAAWVRVREHGAPGPPNPIGSAPLGGPAAPAEPGVGGE